jgi:hypothetical protein
MRAQTTHWLCTLSAAIWVLAFHGADANAASITVGLDPRASYLRAGNESPPNAAAIDLSLVGAGSGSTILLEVLGDYLQRSGAPEASTTTGVFSSSNVLLGPSFPASATNYNRVGGAIDAGIDLSTGPTFFPTPNGLPTDIPEDFLIGTTIGSSLQIVVPEGARYLFASSLDSFYTDNSDTDRDYAVRVSLVPTAPVVPLPAAVWSGLGLIGIVAVQRALRTRKSLP